jgi:hypothetical protein
VREGGSSEYGQVRTARPSLRPDRVGGIANGATELAADGPGPSGLACRRPVLKSDTPDSALRGRGLRRLRGRPTARFRWIGAWTLRVRSGRSDHCRDGGSDRRGHRRCILHHPAVWRPANVHAKCDRELLRFSKQPVEPVSKQHAKPKRKYTPRRRTAADGRSHPRERGSGVHAGTR